jgi:hypothetical protein
VLHQLEAVLQQHPVALGSADVRGDIERVGTTWVLSLDVQVGTQHRVRRLSASDCEALADAAAVALVLLLEPLRDLDLNPTQLSRAPEDSAPTQAPLGPPSAPALANASVAEKAPDEEPDSEASHLAWKLGAEAVLDSSTLAGPALGASFQSQLSLVDWSLAAYGIVLPARRRAAGPGDYVEFAHAAAGLRVCYELWNGAPQVLGCAGAELGRFTGRGSGLDVTRRQVRDWWLAPSAGSKLAWHLLPHAALLGRIEAMFPVLQENYVINGGDPVHDTPSATLRASVGLEFDLL